MHFVVTLASCEGQTSESMLSVDRSGGTTAAAIALSGLLVAPFGCDTPARELKRNKIELGAAASATSSVAKPVESPEAQTQRIARQWAYLLPSFQLRAKMCDQYEISHERDRAPLDAWGTPLQVRCDQAATNYVLTSAGPDRHLGTADDLTMRYMSSPMTFYR